MEDCEDFSSTVATELHNRAIIHIDIDCFYAQAETIRNPHLKDKPLGVQQKHLMITCNYVARSMGLKKNMPAKAALQQLPSLTLIDGSDLAPYRELSSAVSTLLQSYTPHVERLGMDENFLDVTNIISTTGNQFMGHIYAEDRTGASEDRCGCGCFKKLSSASCLAKEIRQKIFETTGLTTCAGIAHNKLLAKLVSSANRPNDQTLLWPWRAHHLLNTLDSPRSIPGIGHVTYNSLCKAGIITLQDLQNASISILNKYFNQKTSEHLKNLSHGRDDSSVKGSGKPLTIGVEDAFRFVTTLEEVKNTLSSLIKRLLKLLLLDGRIPSSMKLSVRKAEIGQRESKQFNLSTTVLKRFLNDKIDYESHNHLLEISLQTFHKMVNANAPFQLSLLGVAFVKLEEEGKNSVMSFCKKLKIPRAESNAASLDCPIDVQLGKASEGSVSFGNQLPETSELLPDMSAEEISEESPKKDTSETTLGRNTLDESNTVIGASKSRMSSLNLPDGVDEEVFNSLPEDIQEEILESNAKRNTQAHSRKNKSPPKQRKVTDFFRRL